MEGNGAKIGRRVIAAYFNLILERIILNASYAVIPGL